MPATPIFKVTLKFNQAAQGWTETYYRGAVDAPTAAFFTGNAVFPQALLATILAPRMPGVVLYAISASDVLNPRVSFQNIVQGSLPPILVGGEGPDVTATGALLKMTASDGSTRFTWLRGLPDIFVARDLAGNAVLNAQFANALNSYRDNFIKPYGLSMKKLTRQTLLQPDPIIRTVAMNLVNPNQMDVTIVGPVPAVGSNIVFHRMPKAQFPGLVGSFPVVSVAGQVITVPYRYRTLPNPFNPANATIRATVYTYPAILLLQLQDFRTHRTGRPIGQPRGRRPAGQRRV